VKEHNKNKNDKVYTINPILDSSSEGSPLKDVGGRPRACGHNWGSEAVTSLESKHPSVRVIEGWPEEVL
jgi:hypothetical protein